MITRTFKFLTAAFPHGAYQSQGFNDPDLRAPSIKGQLRWWYDALYQDKAAEDRLFGGLKVAQARGAPPGPASSRVIVRVRSLHAPSIAPTAFMPHKGDRGGAKRAIPPGASYEVSLNARREGIDEVEHKRLENTLSAWLLLGAVGQRANRAAGSIWPDDAPGTTEGYGQRAGALLTGTRLRHAVLDTGSGKTERELRYLAGEFLAAEAFLRIQTPFGSASPRKPSPLKLRAAHLDGSLKLVAVFDGRHQSTDSLRQGIAQLAKSSRIGELLQQAVGKLCG